MPRTIIASSKSSSRSLKSPPDIVANAVARLILDGLRSRLTGGSFGGGLSGGRSGEQAHQKETESDLLHDIFLLWSVGIDARCSAVAQPEPSRKSR